MTRPQLQNSISLGNIMTAILMIVGVIGGFYAQSARIDVVETRVSQVEDRAEESRKATAANTQAVRTLEMSAAAIGERLKSIEQGTLRVERMLEQLVQERRQ